MTWVESLFPYRSHIAPGIWPKPVYWRRNGLHIEEFAFRAHGMWLFIVYWMEFKLGGPPGSTVKIRRMLALMLHWHGWGCSDELSRNICLLKVHSHKRQHLRLHVHLHQDDNIVSMRMLCQMQRMGVEPILCVWHNILKNMLQFDANAQADANVDARVNGPLREVSIGYSNHFIGDVANNIDSKHHRKVRFRNRSVWTGPRDVLGSFQTCKIVWWKVH